MLESKEVFKLQWEEPESSGALLQDEQIIAVLGLESLVNSTPDGSCTIATRGLLKVTVGESAEMSLGPRRWWFGFEPASVNFSHLQQTSRPIRDNLLRFFLLTCGKLSFYL
jgi:hypothetical protein